MRKWIIMTAIVMAVSVLWLLSSTPLSVETAVVQTRPLTVTVQEQGRTRARLPYTITAPVNGHLLRNNLIEGMSVQQGDVLAQIALLAEDTRTEASIRANLAAAEARQRAAEATLIETESALPRAQREAERRERLFLDRLISEEERDSYQQTEAAAEARLLSARAAVIAAQADVQNARAALMGLDGNQSDSNNLTVTAPVSGTVQAVYERGDRVIAAGTELFRISDGDALELVIDLLTQDAVQVSPGDTILITGWGGQETLPGTVDYIEPQAFTKYSALGVEEQRVNVIGRLTGSNGGPPLLGAEYRIEANIVVWQEDEVLTVPISALFRRDNNWHVFVVEQEQAVLRQIRIGRRNRDLAQVLDGLQQNDQVIVFPSDQVMDGSAVTTN
ncbi:efflux RND transporter periplasmic adaptor subunit [Pseudohongiella sp.]|uniref:RND efflux pump membrane fusion protein barrel-sandwich domain-containing protein n=1 Tax=marine sediment metagenome TaxID=412755 RepID=A0A0F9VPE3_9ZZZZ|nr:efflux RND transporter periplasmic adaptor subunit [Pseudohongiella sp.]HDZ10197.1 efflux RND transporter periplasmic adaptor subunit [Pseudohongiella sp.]HEA64271.1 efflux RND transporter periplasmic adaptor subunit [Pseudohongiella sp.]